jgi:hypothetical protein
MRTGTDPLLVDKGVSNASTTRNVSGSALSDEMLGVAAKRLATQMRDVTSDIFLSCNAVCCHIDQFMRDNFGPRKIDSSVSCPVKGDTSPCWFQTLKDTKSIRFLLYPIRQEVLRHSDGSRGSRKLIVRTFHFCEGKMMCIIIFPKGATFLEQGTPPYNNTLQYHLTIYES